MIPLTLVSTCIVNPRTNLLDNTNELAEPDNSDPIAVWNHAVSLAGKGLIDEASKFFKIHAKLTKDPVLSTPSTSTKRQIGQITNTPQATKQTNIVSEGGLKFIPGAITSHTLLRQEPQRVERTSTFNNF